MKEDWTEESRSRVNETIKKASRFRGTMQTKGNIEALEKAQAELKNRSQESSKKDYK